MSIFEKVSKNKVRFDTGKGLISTEDLWDMPLSGDAFSLDELAKSLNRQVKASEEESFVKPHSKVNSMLTLALDIVKRVIEVKLANIQTQEKRAATIAQRNKILEILASKEDDSLREKSAEELRAMLESD